MKALKESSVIRQGQKVNIPTWTGKSGRAGIPLISSSSSSINRNNVGLNNTSRPSATATSSKSLLEQIRQRQSQSDVPVSLVRDRYAVILADLRSLFLRYGGRASSSTVIEAFRDRVTDDELTLFRKLLKRIAKFDTANKVWYLTPDDDQ